MSKTRGGRAVIRRIGALLVALVSSATAAAGVIVVDAAGGGDHTSLGAACQAAASGDVVLVRPGTYQNGAGQPNFIIAKSLTVVGDGPGVVTSAFLVQNMPAGATVVIRGVETDLGFSSVLGSGLVVRDNAAGRLVVEDCTFAGQAGQGVFVTLAGEPGALVQDTPSVSFARCTFEGGEGIDTFVPYAPDAGEGGPGLRVEGSVVTLHDCTLRGGDAGDFTIEGVGPGGQGGPALRVVESELLIGGCTLEGGVGGDGNDETQTSGYGGGDGVRATGAGVVVRELDNTLAPGAGGFDTAGVQGPSGEALAVPVSGLFSHADLQRHYALSGPARENGSVTLTYQGEVGDLLGIYFSLGADHLPLTAKAGSWLLATPWTLPVVLGTVGDPGGLMEITFPLGPSDPGFDGGRLLSQALVATSGGALRPSGLATFVLLDESY